VRLSPYHFHRVFRGMVGETYALLLRRMSYRAATTFLTDVVVPPTTVVTSSPDYEARARIDWLVKYRDQPCSFPDVVSFASMRDRHIRGALTLDHHFSTAGFVMVSSRVDA